MKWFNKVRYNMKKNVRRYIRRVLNKAVYGWEVISREYLKKTLNYIMTTEFHGEGLEKRRVVREPCECKTHARFDEGELEKQAALFACYLLYPTFL